jgi:hypothetical protein
MGTCYCACCLCSLLCLLPVFVAVIVAVLVLQLLLPAAQRWHTSSMREQHGLQLRLDCSTQCSTQHRKRHSQHHSPQRSQQHSGPSPAAAPAGWPPEATAPPAATPAQPPHLARRCPCCRPHQHQQHHFCCCCCCPSSCPVHPASHPLPLQTAPQQPCLLAAHPPACMDCPAHLPAAESAPPRGQWPWQSHSATLRPSCLTAPAAPAASVPWSAEACSPLPHLTAALRCYCCCRRCRCCRCCCCWHRGLACCCSCCCLLWRRCWCSWQPGAAGRAAAPWCRRHHHAPAGAQGSLGAAGKALRASLA